MKIAEIVIYLASCAVNGTKPETAKIAGMDLDLLFSFASYHMLSAVVAMALERAGCKDGRLKNAISFSVRKAQFAVPNGQSYLENRTPAAGRIFWFYESDRGDMTIIGMELHPNDKSNAYDTITLSSMGEEVN